MDSNPWADSGNFNAPKAAPPQGRVNNQPQSFNPGFNSYGYQDFSQIKKQNDKRMIKKLGLYTGGALLLVVFIQNVMVIALAVIGQLNLYLDNKMFQASFDIILTVFGMLLPFMLMGRKMKKVSGEESPLLTGRPTGAVDFILAVVAGTGICFAANFVTSLVTVALALVGLEPSSPEIAMPEGPFGIVLSFARIAVVAGVVEELSLRGCVMGNLRRYGDVFAIVMSAFVFGFMHGNLIQTPFALVAGIGLGYFSVKTNSLWTGIIIHIINNGVSVFFTYLYDYFSEETVNLAYLIFLWGTIFVGFIALLIFRYRNKNRKLRKNQSALSFGQAARYFLLSPTMIVSMLYMLYVTASFLSKLE